MVVVSNNKYVKCEGWLVKEVSGENLGSSVIGRKEREVLLCLRVKEGWQG